MHYIQAGNEKKSSILSRKWENCLIELDQNSNMTKLDWIWLNLIKLDQNLIELESLSLYEYECNIYKQAMKKHQYWAGNGEVVCFPHMMQNCNCQQTWQSNLLCTDVYK